VLELGLILITSAVEPCRRLREQHVKVTTDAFAEQAAPSALATERHSSTSDEAC